MKNSTMQNTEAFNLPNEDDNMLKNSSIPRRKFVKDVAPAAVAFTILPRSVPGGKGFVAPSDKSTLAYICVGTQGRRELLPLLANEQFKVTAICDPNKDAVGYSDWSTDGLKNEIRKMIQKPGWAPGGDDTIPGGRDNGKSIVDTFYANVHPELQYKGCNAYADVRELLHKEKDLDAVKQQTTNVPDANKWLDRQYRPGWDPASI